MHRAEDAVFKNNDKIIYMNLLTPGFGLLIWTLLAFLIVFFILKKYAWPAIIKGLKDREHSIADSLATAEKVRAEMAQLKNENEELLTKAREERGQLLKEARETKERIINESKEQAKVEANKIIAAAQAVIDTQKMAAITEIKNQVGKMVIEISEKVLRRELSNKETQEEHIKGMIKEVKLN
jgi:F-type H+-transporting ATPase subunit b